MSEEFIPTLTHATERDIDLLLVEELYASPNFVAWICGRAGLPTDITTSSVLHSKRRTRSRREIDIFVDLALTDGSRAALLIENKLDATEQPDQAESYREELTILAEPFAKRAMAIVCPDQYRADHKEFVEKFDAAITYEELAHHFRESSTGSDVEAARMSFRADLLDQAVRKSRRGYTPLPNAVIGGFNAQYVALLRQAAPNIVPGPSMLKDANPDESVSMIFDHARSFANLPKEIRPTRFAHEFGRGMEHRANYVAVVFGGWGSALSVVKEQFLKDTAVLGAAFSSKPATKTRPNPGLVMTCQTPAIDNQADFGAQTPSILAGIQQATALRDWLLQNQSLLFRWKRQVQDVIDRS